MSILCEISKLEVIEIGQSIEPISIWYEVKRVTQKGILGGKVLGFNMFNHDTIDSYNVKLWLTRRYVQITKSRGGFQKCFYTGVALFRERNTEKAKRMHSIDRVPRNRQYRHCGGKKKVL